MSAIELTAAWVTAAVSGVVVSGDRARTFTGVSIDTRTLKTGELYIAIRGERFDGADFAEAAIVAGAAGVVVPRGRGAALAAATIIEVDDTTVALQALAHAVRIASGTKVVAITGSAGKTTTKEITAEFLAARYRVMRNRGNFNNHIGLPLSLIELTARPDIAVVELGMNHAGEISTLVRVAEPEVRVRTNVGEAHLGFFASLDAIADAKAEILERATPATVLVANADDERIAARCRRFAGRTVTFGIDADADIRATHVVDRGIEGIAARVSTPTGDVEIATPLIGRANLANLLAGTAVALDCRPRLDAPSGVASRRSGSSRARRDDRRRQLQRQPDGDAAGARGARGRRPYRPAGGRARRDARARRGRRRVARRGRPSCRACARRSADHHWRRCGGGARHGGGGGGPAARACPSLCDE